MFTIFWEKDKESLSKCGLWSNKVQTFKHISMTADCVWGEKTERSGHRLYPIKILIIDQNDLFAWYLLKTNYFIKKLI